jgi:hypothetical protein
MIRRILQIRVALLLLSVLLLLSTLGGAYPYSASNSYSAQATKAANAAASQIREQGRRVLNAIPNNDKDKAMINNNDKNESHNVNSTAISESNEKRHLAHDGPECGEDGSGLNHDGEPCKYAYEEGDSLYVDGYIDHTITGAQLTNGRYPSTTLSCYSSYTKPDGMLICPESRSKYCVKELSTLKQDLCGQSQYFGDQYQENLCVLRKCAAECEEGQYSFQYGGLTYVRNRFCCQENYCNSSSKNIASSLVLTVVTILVSCIVFIM